MDKRLQILHHLYGETDEAAEPLDALLDDPAVKAEYEGHAAVKRALDQRPPARPDAAVLDRVLAAAASPAAVPVPLPPRQDRAARPSPRLRLFRRMSALAAVFALLLAVGIVWQQVGQDPLEATSADSAEQAAPMIAERAAPLQDEAAPRQNEAAADAVEAEPAPAPPAAVQAAPADDLARSEAAGARNVAAVPPAAVEAPARRDRAAREGAAARLGAGQAALEAEEAARTRADADVALDEVAVMSGVAGAMANTAAKAEADVPAWDEGDEVMRLRNRIALLEARARAENWDGAAVMSLDQLPPAAGPPALIAPASTRKPPDH